MVKKRQRTTEPDGAYVLKLVLYVIMGSLWLKIDKDMGGMTLSLPVGLLIGLIFASHEHFRIDRKVEYAALIVATLIGLIAPYGLFIAL